MSDQPQYPSYPGGDEPTGGAPQEPPTYGQPSYGHAAPDGQPSYGQPAYGQPTYQQPPYGQPQYGQAQPNWGSAYPQPGTPPQPGYGYPQPPKTNGLALWSMILGIVSIVFCYLGLLIGPVAVGLALSGKKQIKAKGGTESGDGMATAGLITGIIGTVIWAGFIAFLIILGVNGELD